MKKLAFIGAVCAAACGAYAASPNDVMLYFSSEGPDCYADGTQALDGEVYALVWTSDGVFDGFTADGALVDANDVVLLKAGLAKGGRCPAVLFDVAGEDAKSGGQYGVYLLDTRVRTKAADGSVVTTVGLAEDGSFKAVNGYAVAAKSVSTDLANATKAGASETMTVADVPADAPQPKIAAIEVKGGKVVVQVADTVPYVTYGISAGPDVGNMTKNDLVPAVNGDKDGLTLIVNDPDENRFFKVIRK